MIELLRASNRPQSEERAAACWAPLRWLAAAKPVITSLWAGAGILLVFASGAVVLLANGVAGSNYFLVGDCVAWRFFLPVFSLGVSGSAGQFVILVER